MNEQTFFANLLKGWPLLAVIIFLALLFITAPYGRHLRKGWGPAINNKLGWVIMEASAPIVFAICFLLGSNTKTAVTLAFLCLWEIHYIHRAFIYPLGTRSSRRNMLVAIVGFGLFFNSVNGYLNGRYIFTLSGGYTNQWLGDPRFVIGVIFFITGFVINRRSDQILRSLRRTGEPVYRIPCGWLYGHVERAQMNHTEEFYEVTDSSFDLP